MNPLISFAEIMGERLTNLNLSHNKLTGLPQILNAISVIISYFQHISCLITNFYFADLKIFSCKKTTNMHKLAIFTRVSNFENFKMLFNVNIVLASHL